MFRSGGDAVILRVLGTIPRPEVDRHLREEPGEPQRHILLGIFAIYLPYYTFDSEAFKSRTGSVVMLALKFKLLFIYPGLIYLDTPGG